MVDGQLSNALERVRNIQEKISAKYADMNGGDNGDSNRKRKKSVSRSQSSMRSKFLKKHG